MLTESGNSRLTGTSMLEDTRTGWVLFVCKRQEQLMEKVERAIPDNTVILQRGMGWQRTTQYTPWYNVTVLWKRQKSFFLKTKQQVFTCQVLKLIHLLL